MYNMSDIVCSWPPHRNPTSADLNGFWQTKSSQSLWICSPLLPSVGLWGVAEHDAYSCQGSRSSAPKLNTNLQRKSSWGHTQTHRVWLCCVYLLEQLHRLDRWLYTDWVGKSSTKRARAQSHTFYCFCWWKFSGFICYHSEASLQGIKNTVELWEIWSKVKARNKIQCVFHGGMMKRSCQGGSSTRIIRHVMEGVHKEFWLALRENKREEGGRWGRGSHQPTRHHFCFSIILSLAKTSSWWVVDGGCTL